MATVANAAVPRTIPGSIRSGLRRVGRRLRVLGALEGLGRLACVLAAGAAVGMAMDFAWPLPAWTRWAVWLAWVGAGAAMLVATVVRPLVRRMRWAELAAVAEAGHPGPGERLVSAVELIRSGGSAHGSPELIGALAGEAESRARGLDPARAVTGRAAGRWLGWGALALAVVAAPAAARPDPFATLARRFLMPWAGIARVDRFVVTVRPGDAVAAIGSEVDFRADVRPRFGGGVAPGSAWLEWTDDEGRARRAAMTAASDEPTATRSFTFAMRGVAGSFDYRVVSGPAASRTHRITAVEPPAVAALSARVEPPAYTKFPAAEAKDPGRLNVWEGSRVTLRVTPTRPVRRVALSWPTPSKDGSAPPEPIGLTPTPDGHAWEATVEAAASGSYGFTLTDADGLRSRPEMPRRVRVVPDAPPVVALGGTDSPMEAKADDVLLVDVAARDDVAVASATLVYAVARGGADAGEPEEGRSEAQLDGLGTRAAAGRAALVLRSLGLRAGDEVAYLVEVADNRPAPRGPNVTRTRPRILRVRDQAKPLFEQEGSAERGSLREALEALRRAAAANHQAAVQLRYAADAALRGNGRWSDEQARSLDEREAEARKILDGLVSLARDFLDSGRFAPLAEPARQVAEVEAEGARAMLDQARHAPDAARRLADLRQADGRLAVVKNRLDELARKFDELARQDDDRRRLGLLAERQDELARRAEELARDGANPSELDRVRQEQEALRREVDEITRRSPELRAEVLARRAREADDLARRARELAERQREEARRSDDTPARAEALRALAQEQKAIEVEARRLAMEVDPTLEDNGRGRLNTDALARPAEPLAQGDVEQARQRLDEAENELRRLARELAELRHDPRALARRLAQRQQELNNQAKQTINQANTPESKAALPETLRPLAERQAAIARLAAAIPAPEAQRAQVEQAATAAARAAEDLREARADQAPPHLDEAFHALNILANVLPDPNQVRQQAQQRIDEARGQMDQIGRELVQHLRDTAPRPDPQSDPVASARELARRVEPLIARQDEIAARLAELDPGPDAVPQRDRAARRAAALADALHALKESAPPESAQAQSRPGQPVADWHVVGPFARDQPPPVPVGGPVDLKAVLKDRQDRPATWKGVPAGDRGLVDLNAAFPGAGGHVSAFGYAEVPSPGAGPGRLVLGSDDTLTVWLNGRQVFDFQGNRAYAPDQDAVAVEFAAGVNRLLVRCGNGDGDWKFSVSATAPPSGEVARQLARVDQFRRHLPLAQSDARVALDRLQEALWGRPPADALAAELAHELTHLQSQISDPGSAPGDPARPPASSEARRIATALRALNVPDAPAPQAEAARLADRAARALEQPDSDPGADPAPLLTDAARAARDLAARLVGAQPPAERAAALARAQRGLDEPDAPRDPASQARLQHALADDLARIPPAPGDARARAESAMADAVALADRAAQPPAPEPDALTRSRTRAAEALDALARQAPADPDAPEPSPPDAAPVDPRALATALAERQRALAREARQEQRRVDQAPETERDAARAGLPDRLAPLAERQHALAAAARALPDPHPAAGEPRRAAESHRVEARRAQARAADALARAEPARAADEADRAADALDQLARSLPEGPVAGAGAGPASPPAPEDPELALDPAHADAARALARRERHLRERLQSMMAGRIAPQEGLRDEAARLGGELAALRDQTRDLSPRSHGPANNAAQLMQNQAASAMTQGAEQLAQGRPDAARQAQRQAADHVEHAARSASDLASALRADIPPDSRSASDADGSPPSDGLASARQAQQRAGEQLAQARAPGSSPSDSSRSAEAASASMRQAARGLRAASTPPGRPSSRSAAGRLAGDPSGPASADPLGGLGNPVAPHLGALPGEVPPGRGPGRAWGELPGHLRTEILQASEGRYRDDYARLIQLYFREIAGAPAPDSDSDSEPPPPSSP